MEQRLADLSEQATDEELMAVISDPALTDLAKGKGFTNAAHSNLAREHLAWAKREQLVQVTPAEIPVGILPEGHSARVIDIKVKPKGRVRTDDEVYLQNPEIREKVPRGTCLFQLDSAGHDNLCCAIFSLRKFTGGLGDDDDVETEDQADWKQYFLEPLESSTHFVSMAKANGEAAHLGVRWILDRFVLFIGSKNVHLAACSRRDLARYKDDRYMVAKQIADYMFEFVDAMEEGKRARLFTFLAASRLTATFEFLQVEHQHVELLTENKLCFLAFTSTSLRPSASLCLIKPVVGLRLARLLGFDTVDYQTLPTAELTAHIASLRELYGKEGAVLYFLNGNGQAIGLQKMKTVWYIQIRALREKIRYYIGQLEKNNSDPDKADILMEQFRKKMTVRCKQIRQWLHLDDRLYDAWLDLLMSMADWAFAAAAAKTLSCEDVQHRFPVVWHRFLTETGKTDKL